MKKLLIENLSELTIVQKADFEAVDSVFNALDFTFHPDGLENDEPDERFISLWRLFLITVGWKEDDYWDEWNLRLKNHKCDQCSEKEDLKSGDDFGNKSN